MLKRRIIFDRSAFHGNRFDRLLSSSLMKLSKQRRISIYHSPILIEETIRMYMKEKNREELRRQLPFIFEICQERWFRGRSELWSKELVEEAGEKGSVFMPDIERRMTEENIKRMVFHDDFDENMFECAIKEIDENKIKAGRIKEISIKMRSDVSERLKSVRKSRCDIKQTAEEYVDLTSDDTGTEILTKHLITKNPLEIADKWRKHKKRFPYFTLFVRGLLYLTYYVMAEPNEPIDDNALIDISQLTYLHGADIIVSNDEKFMKKTFDFMYKGRSKRMMTCEQFVAYLKEIDNTDTR